MCDFRKIRLQSFLNKCHSCYSNQDLLNLNLTMLCPGCGQSTMLFDDHHGMEHNVCEECGTVVECELLVTDIFQPGLQNVSYNYQGKPDSYKYGYHYKHHGKAVTDNIEIMSQLMDRLNLPISARELAMYFFKYSRYMPKRCCVGACVYLAMKRHDLPVTIKYISNYLEISHYAVGKAMKTLEGRIGPQAQSNAFNVGRLVHLIFNQAKFGGNDGGKKRLDLLLNKTKQLVQVLECQKFSTSQPHIIILAAGYIVWRNLKCHGWRETQVGSGSSSLNMSNLRRPTLKIFLCEVGIKLSSLSALYDKINSISTSLCSCTDVIPWMSCKVPSKDLVYFHLDDFLTYKSQIDVLVAQDMLKEEEIKVEDSNGLQENSSSKVCDQTEQSESSILEDCKVNSENHCAIEDFSHAILESSQGEETPKFNFSINFDADLGYASIIVKANSDKDKEQNGQVFKKIKFTKMTGIRKAPKKQIKKEIPDSDKETLQKSVTKNNGDQFKKNTTPSGAAIEESYLKCLSFP